MKRLILGVGAVWRVASIASSSSLALLQHRPASAAAKATADKARQVTSVFGCSLIEPSMSTGAVAQ